MYLVIEEKNVSFLIRRFGETVRKAVGLFSYPADDEEKLRKGW